MTGMSNRAEANLSALIESTEDLIWSVDLDYALLTFNRAMQRSLEHNYGVQAEIGKGYLDLLPPDRVAIWPPLFERAIAEGPFRTEVPFLKGRTLEVSFNPIVVHCEATGISVFGRDITDKKAAEAALNEAEKRFRAIFDGALEGMFQTTFEGQCILANPALVKMLGYDSLEEFTSTIKDSAHDVWAEPEERAGFIRLLDEQGVVLGFECQFKRKDGTKIWASLNCRKALGADGVTLINEGFVEDITERRRAAEELTASATRLRSFFQESRSVMLLLEASSGEIVSANRAASAFYGYPPEQLVGMYTSQINTEPLEQLALDRQSALNKERNFFTYRNRLASGEVRDVEVYASPFVVNGKPLLFAIIHDVTERKRAEESLRASEETLRESQSIAGLGSYVLDIRTGVWNSSEVLDLIFGIGKDYDHTVAGWTGLIHPEDQAMMAAYFAGDVVGLRRPFDKEYRIVRQTDQEVRWVHGLGRLEFDAQGQPVKMRGTIKDITERRLAETRLRDSEERYRATFEQAAVGIVHTSFEGTFLRCNARFAEIVGYPQQEIPGMTFQQITIPEDLDASLDTLHRMSHETIENAAWEKRYIRKDGSIVWVKMTVSMQRDAEGRALHSIAVVEDIGSRKATEERLATAQEALRTSEERHRIAFQASSNAVSIVRLSDGMYLDVNPVFLETLGMSREEVIGKTVRELNIFINTGDLDDLAESLRRRSAFRGEVPLRKKSGDVLWGLMSASVFEHDGVFCVQAVTQDISDAKAAEARLAAATEALRVSEERYRTAFQTSLDAININRLEDGVYIDCNAAFLKITGYEREEVIGRSSLELAIWADTRDRSNLIEILRRNSVCRDLEARFRKKDGEVFWGLMSASVFELDGVPCLLSITRDISDAKAAEDKIRSLNFYDSLTGLPNRRLLLERLRQTLADSASDLRMQTLLLVDLDNFKTLNETLGHQTGDLLLQEAAQRLISCIGEEGTVARLGGDEFLVMLEERCATAEDAAILAKETADRMLMAISQPYLLAGHACRSTASIGIAVFGDSPDTVDEILQKADIALDQAKTTGRNAVRFFVPALQEAVNARAALEAELRLGIKTYQFELFYQPQVNRARLIGAEALIRWNHPKRGLLTPGEFIPLAEETGLILPLGDWVLETACTQIAAWADRLATAPIPVAVNISARQFRQSDFVDGVLAALDRTGANPRHLELELTESMLVDDIEDIIAKMTALKSHGLKFSLDDFGTGYSSLAYLKRLPLDQLKIDRSFVKDILVDASSGAIAQTILSLSRAMDLPVIAEGVETDEQRVYLARLGCHSFQGYLFGRPLPLQEFESLWLSTARNAAPAFR
jgi:diguanylate cyclase (GGDEF)-like protein/PAS domain S-box-containing protein